MSANSYLKYLTEEVVIFFRNCQSDKGQHSCHKDHPEYSRIPPEILAEGRNAEGKAEKDHNKHRADAVKSLQRTLFHHVLLPHGCTEYQNDTAQSTAQPDHRPPSPEADNPGSGGGPDDQSGTVEFTATWSGPEGAGHLHETSRFARRAGRWFYVDGDVDEG